MSKVIGIDLGTTNSCVAIEIKTCPPCPADINLCTRLMAR